MESAIAIANEIIEREIAAGRALDAYKLQKLLYYVQVYSVVKDGQRAFPEPIQAWRDGPLTPTVYDFHRGLISVTRPFTAQRCRDTAIIACITYVLSLFSTYNGHQMVDLTHSERPWVETFDPNTPRGNGEITMEKIRRGYFKANGEVKALPLATARDLELQDTLNNPDRAASAAGILAETNFPLLASTVFTHVDGESPLDEYAMADVVEAIGDNWTQDPEAAREALLSSIHHPDGLVQEYALKGLMRFLVMGDDKVKVVLSDLNVEELDPDIRPLAHNLLGAYFQHA